MKVKEINKINPVCISDEATTYDAHLLMQNRGVRHMPVISEQAGLLVGVLTHKKMLASILNLYNRYGAGALDRKERHTPIKELMETEHPVLFADNDLVSVVDYFLEHKYGCLPVSNADGKVVGIVTSSDFVKLSKLLLSQQVK